MGFLSLGVATRWWSRAASLFVTVAQFAEHMHTEPEFICMNDPQRLRV